MQNEGNFEGKCNIDRPFSIVVMQRVMAECGQCMYNRDYAENWLSMQNESNVEGKCKIARPFSKVVMQSL